MVEMPRLARPNTASSILGTPTPTPAERFRTRLSTDPSALDDGAFTREVVDALSTGGVQWSTVSRLVQSTQPAWMVPFMAAVGSLLDLRRLARGGRP